MRSLLPAVLVFTLGFICAAAITTIHHDKPESVTISTIKTSTIARDEITTSLELTNRTITISPSERKKRLLPYQNFYFNQPFNRPHQAGVSAQQYKSYGEVEGPNNKKPNTESIRLQPSEHDFQSGQKFTPFLESNALPGPFRPMVNVNHPSSQKVQYVLVERPSTQEESRGGNIRGQAPQDLSAIYDKLSQLKLRQQGMYEKAPHGPRVVPQYRLRERPQKLHDYRPGYDVPRYRINPTKTTIEMFTATNIDIPDRNEDEKYNQPEPPRYHLISTPIKEETAIPAHSKYRENTKPFIHHQVAIEIPQSSLPLSFTPNLGRKPGHPKERPRTYVLIQQGKANPNQPTIVLRKPKPSVVVDESYVAEKLVPALHPKPHHYQHHQPIYIPQQQQYRQHLTPVYENTYEAQYQVTPTPSEQYQYLDSSSYDETPATRKVENIPDITQAPALASNHGNVQEYYQYQPVTPGPGPPTPAPVRFAQKLVPQYGVEYRASTERPRVEDSKGSSLAEVLKQLQESNTLPHTLTPDNIDNSIKTLVKILNALRDRQKQQKPIVVQDEYEYDNEAGVDLGGDVLDTPDGGTPGKAGVDYPALSSIPKTTFSCKTQRYKGFFGDPDTNCQVWHYCDLNGGQASFLCPNGTIFSQVALTCDWWYNVKCASTAQLYVLNERLYKYIIPLSPKFPEDYSGPLVDKYLAMKFQEMEEKMKRQKKGKGNKDSKESDESSEDDDDEDTTEDDVEDADSSKEESQVIEETEKPTIDGNETTETTAKDNIKK